MTLSEPIEGQGWAGAAGPRSSSAASATVVAVTPREARPVRARPVRVEVISTVADLAASLRLRYEVYNAMGYIPADESGMDVDAYDACSLSIGAFDACTGMLVGTMRVISTRSLRTRRILVEAAAGPRALVDLRDPTLPSLASPEIRELVAREAGDGLPVRELSRCVVDPAWRGRGILRDLVQGGMAVARRERPALLVGACAPEHVPMYARHGFRLLRQDGQMDYFPAVGRRGCVLVCAPGDAVTP